MTYSSACRKICSYSIIQIRIKQCFGSNLLSLSQKLCYFLKGRRSYSISNDKSYAHIAKIEDVSMLQDLRLKWRQDQIAQARFIAALEVLDVKKRFLEPDARMLA